MTLRTVPNSGFPSLLRALYSASRAMPVSRESCAIPLRARNRPQSLRHRTWIVTFQRLGQVGRDSLFIGKKVGSIVWNCLDSYVLTPSVRRS